MTNLELVLTMLAEASTKEISKKKKPKTFPQNKQVAHQGGHVAKTARKEIETHTSEKVVSSRNAQQLASSSRRKLK